MINKIRPIASKYLNIVAKPIAEIGLTPSHISILGLFLSIVSITPLLILKPPTSNYTFSLMILASGFMDALDGALARITNKTSPWGSFLDSVIDRIADSTFILYIYIGGILVDEILIMLLIITSLLISYIRSKAEALMIPISGVGLIERGERLAFLLTAPIISVYNETYAHISLYILLILSTVTIFQRIYYVWRRLRN